MNDIFFLKTSLLSPAPFFLSGRVNAGELSTRYSANALTHIYARIHVVPSMDGYWNAVHFRFADESNYHIKLFIDSLRI